MFRDLLAHHYGVQTTLIVTKTVTAQICSETVLYND
jgi:hypothetical protein